VRFVGPEDTLRDAAGDAEAKAFTSRLNGSQGVGVLHTRKRAALKARQTVFDDGEEDVIEHAGGRTLDATGAVLELDAAHILRPAVLDAVGVVGVPRLGVALVQRGDVRGGVVRDGSDGVCSLL
jgi:hypothetical protein